MDRRGARLPGTALLVGALLLACSAGPIPSPGREKPGAPVTLQLARRELEPGLWAVELIATPTVDVDALELALPGRRAEHGPVRAGEARTLAARVVVAPGAGLDVIGEATLVRRGARRGASAALRLGAQPPAARVTPARVVTLPGGVRVAEPRR